MIRRAMPREQQRELCASLLEVSKSCPVEQCNPKDCPLFPLRKLSPKRRVQWLQALDEEDLKYLAAYHYICLSTKMEAQLGTATTRAARSGFGRKSTRVRRS